MSEQELKLHVPPARVDAVAAELAGHQATYLALRAMYFDTPQRELVQARIALRLRQEGEVWVQTVKMPGANAISRIELNHPRPGPVLDLSVYAGTEVGQALARIRGPLGVCYETDVQRLRCDLNTPRGLVEAALDRGVLRAGGLELPICEIEFELLSGRPQSLFELGHDWLQRHGLVLDIRSKAERGDALAQLAADLAGARNETQAQQRVARFWTPRMAAPVRLQADLSLPQAMSRIAEECLEQIIRNTAVVAEVDTAGIYAAATPEHVHQLRVGMRRLRTAWRLFDGAIEAPAPALLDGMRAYFSALGASRDHDVLNDEIVPALMRAGMPTIESATASETVDAATLCRSPALQGWLLALYAWSLDVQPAPMPPIPLPPGDTLVPAIIPLDATPPRPVLRAFLVRRLRKWHKQVVLEGKNFEALDLPARHELRKRAKRLRYGLGFAESLLPRVRLRDYRKQLAQLQDLLGGINDLATAAEHYRALSAQHPQAWFALGWIAARLEAPVAQARPAFVRLARYRGLWRD